MLGGGVADTSSIIIVFPAIVGTEAGGRDFWTGTNSLNSFIQQIFIEHLLGAFSASLPFWVGLAHGL